VDFCPFVLTPVLNSRPLTFLITCPPTQFHLTESHEGAGGIGAGSCTRGSPHCLGFRPLSKPGVEVRLEANDPLQASASEQADTKIALCVGHVYIFDRW
jgi:hypothetical protein